MCPLWLLKHHRTIYVFKLSIMENNYVKITQIKIISRTTQQGLH